MTGPQDWVDWHKPYDDPNSRLSRRLGVVQQFLRQALDERTGPVRLISMCAGEGRDVIPVLEAHSRRDDVTALLVELDPRNATAAGQAARAGGLTNVRVLCADAAVTDNYADAVPADIVLACGIFGNIALEDIERTVRALPGFCAPGATVLWTRGRWKDNDPTPEIRGWFRDSGFDEIDFHGPQGETYTVGANRYTAEPRALATGQTLFRFFR